MKRIVLSLPESIVLELKSQAKKEGRLFGPFLTQKFCEAFGVTATMEEIADE